MKGVEKEVATHSSILAWRILWTEKPGGLPSIGSHRVEHDWSDLAAAAVEAGSAGKESTCSMGDLSLIPGLGRSPGEGSDYPFQYSGLENSMDSIVQGVTESWTWLSDLHFQWKAELGKSKLNAIQGCIWGTSLVVQWLRIHTPSAGGMGLIPGQGARSPMSQVRVHTPLLKDSCTSKLRPGMY